MRYEIRDIPGGGVSVSTPSVIASPKGVAIRPLAAGETGSNVAALLGTTVGGVTWEREDTPYLVSHIS